MTRAKQGTRRQAYRRIDRLVAHVRRPKILTYIVTVTLLMVAAGLFIGFSNSPSNGHIQPGQSGQPGNSSVSQKYILITGQYISFSYPSRFSQIKSDRPSGNVLETYAFSKPPVPFWNLDVVVSRLASGRLQDYSPYSYRLARPSQYLRSTITVNGTTVDEMSDLGSGHSASAFLVHNDFIATVTLSSGSADVQNLLSTLEPVLRSFTWRVGT